MQRGGEPVLLHVIRRNGRRKRITARITGGDGKAALVESKRHGSYVCPEGAMFLDSPSRLFPNALKPAWLVREGHTHAVSLNGGNGGVPAAEVDAAIKSRIIEEALKASVMNKWWELAMYVAAGAAIGALCLTALALAELSSLEGIVRALAREEAARAAAAAARAATPTFIPPGPLEGFPSP